MSHGTGILLIAEFGLNARGIHTPNVFIGVLVLLAV